MQIEYILFALVLSEVRNIELEKRIKGFERLTLSLSNEIDRQSKEIRLLKQRRSKNSKSLRLAA